MRLDDIREHIRTSKYGKFDYISHVLADYELLTWKPRVLMKTLYERLEMEPFDTQLQKSFYAFVSRYRLEKLKKQSIIPLTKAPDNIQNNSDKDWMDFQPSTPRPFSPPSIDDILKPI